MGGYSSSIACIILRGGGGREAAGAGIVVDDRRVLTCAHVVNEDAEALVFPGEREGRPVSDMTLTMVLRRMGVGATVHGFRSAFRDWAGEATNFRREIAAMSLAHTVGNAVEQAYRRSGLRDKRRALMAAWGTFCDGAAAEVQPMARAQVG